MVKRITSRGIGKPDYSINVNNIIRGRVIKDYQLLPNEKWKVFALVAHPGAVSTFPHVINEALSPDTEVFLIDTETGLTQATVPEGYDFKILKIYISSTQPIEKHTYTDGQLVGTAYVVDFNLLQSQELGFGVIQPIDPYFQNSHTVSISVKNLGENPTRASINIQCIMTKVGSPEITSKDIKCRKCGYIKKNVPLSLTRWKCDKCGTLNLYYYFPFGGGLR